MTNKRQSNEVGLELLSFNKLLMDSRKDELNKLSQVRTKLINDSVAEGWSVIQISKATELSRQRVYKILNEGE